MQALTSSDANAYFGLQCLRWERSGQRVLFDAINFSGGCGVSWEGEARERSGDHGFDFVISDPDCKYLRCGSCQYDLSFAIDTSSTKLADDASVGLTLHACDDSERSIGGWQLARQQPHGASCEYAPPFFGEAECGKLHARCRNHCDGYNPTFSGEPCDPGLGCQSVNANLWICVANCSSDEDCAPRDVTHCVNNVCELRRP